MIEPSIDWNEPPSRTKDLKLDTQHEERLRQELLGAWNEGTGDPAVTEIRTKIISHRMRADEETARFHLPAISKIADGAMFVPTAHMILHDCYRRGWAVHADPATSLQHLEAAVAGGSESARWYLATYLLDGDTMRSVLPPDPQRALGILRRLERGAEDVSVRSLSRMSAASYLMRNVPMSELSIKDRELVDQYADDTAQVASRDYLPLALFYAQGADGTDYSGYQYRRSRELLKQGLGSRVQSVNRACMTQLEAWGVAPKSDPVPTATEKAVETIKVTGMLGGVAAVMIFWSFVGLFLLSVAAAINAVMIPIVLIVFGVAAAIAFLRRG